VAKQSGGGGESLSGLTEQMANRIIKPLGLVLIPRERIREVLDEAAEQGRITRHDAEDLLTTLVKLGREQTDDLLSDLERFLGRGRQQFDSAARRARGSGSVDRLVRSADRARRSIGIGSSSPIAGYDDMTVGQVQKRLGGLGPGELRNVREYERRHANRKSVLTAIDKALS
jgi:polyhydroxyalkanoate synthesis regulator phasin